MRKSLIFTIFLVIFALSFSVIAFASGDKIIDDRESGSLTETEKNSLLSALEKAEDKTGYNIYIYVTDSGFIDYDSEGKINSLFDIGGDDDAVILHILDDGYFDPEYGIYTAGSAERLSDATIDRILDTNDVYNNIKSGRIYEGIEAFIDAVPREKRQFEKNSLTAVISISVILALLAAGATVGIIIYKYKRKLKSPSYPLSKFANMNLNHSSDIFLGSSITKTRVSSSSGSGRSGGGGGASFRGKR